MCIILDANLFSDYLQNTDDMAPVRRWLEGTPRTRRRGRLAYSPTAKLESEVNRHQFRHKLVQLTRAGLVRQIPESKVAEAERKLADLKSNDSHVVALALAAKVSVLISRDQDLHVDFKRVAKGKVYQKAAHKHLLTADLCD